MTTPTFANFKNVHGFNTKNKKSPSYLMPYGEKVEVLSKLGSDVIDSEAGAMYHIVGSDGQVWQAFGEELEFLDV